MVDDEEDFLTATAVALERRGFRVLQASTGASALISMKYEYVDVMVLDVRMPDADGHDLYYQLKAIRPDAEAVILTGHGQLKRAFELSKHGLVEYLTKPCDIDELVTAIRTAASKKASNAVRAETEKDAKE
jgi:DNA-binding NtrC family response regulator